MLVRQVLRWLFRFQRYCFWL